jgi:plasmid maintenance system antidote protein VapI
MAMRLEKTFGSTADMWLRMQAAHEAARARIEVADLSIERVKPKAKPSRT